MHTERMADLSTANTRLDERAGAVANIALAIGALGIVASVLIAWLGSMDVSRFFRVWVHNFSFVLTLALGGLFFVLIQHLTRAAWSVVVRRVAEAFAANLRWLWLLFLPIVGLWLTGRLGDLYIWADLEALRANHPDEAALIAGKESYLNAPFFFIRAAVYFVIWAVLSWYFFSRSVRQDTEGGVALTEHMQTVAAPSMILFGLSLTFAAFDWIMSLNPGWFSTIFGVYLFAASCAGAFAAMAAACVILHRQGKLVGIVTPEQFQELGKQLFAFGIVFWAYIAFSQYMLIWYANLPETTGWYLARQLGSWKWLSLALLFGHFVLPFLLLLSRHPKRLPNVLLAIALWMVFFHWLDLYWLVMPEIPHDLGQFTRYSQVAEKYAHETTGLLHPVNWTMLAGMLGLFVAGAVRSLRVSALLPVSDPRLPESLAFENM